MLVILTILLGFGIHLIPDPAFAVTIKRDIEEGRDAGKT
jgi:hypothetical protein